MVERLGSQLIQVFAAEGEIFDTLPTFFRCLRGLVLQVVVGEGIAEILFFLGRVRITRRMELRVVAYSPLCGGNANLTVLPVRPPLTVASAHDALWADCRKSLAKTAE